MRVVTVTRAFYFDDSKLTEIQAINQVNTVNGVAYSIEAGAKRDPNLNIIRILDSEPLIYNVTNLPDKI